MSDDVQGRYSREQFVEALQKLGPEPLSYTTTAVADVVGCAPSTARRRLYGLAVEGIVERDRVGYTIVWLLQPERVGTTVEAEAAESSEVDACPE